MEPASTSSVASIALAKYFGTQLIIGAIATALAFIILPPRTKAEFFGRMVITLLASYLFGPILVAACHAWFPALFDSAAAVAALNGQDVSFGILYISAPLQVVAGMPAWWIIGALMRWFDNRRNADIGTMITEARDTIWPGRANRADGAQPPARPSPISPKPDADA